MGTSEIKSPEVTLGGGSSSIERKKLQVYFIESDNRRMALGRGYTGGTTPVNLQGKPIPVLHLSKTGGWIAAFFIFGKAKLSLLFCINITCLAKQAPYIA